MSYKLLTKVESAVNFCSLTEITLKVNHLFHPITCNNRICLKQQHKLHHLLKLMKLTYRQNNAFILSNMLLMSFGESGQQNMMKPFNYKPNCTNDEKTLLLDIFLIQYDLTPYRQ